jgi:hypothetical protein
MSLENNTELYERAYELVEELTSHPSNIDKRLLQLIEDGDLEELEYVMAVAENVVEKADELEANDGY